MGVNQVGVIVQCVNQEQNAHNLNEDYIFSCSRSNYFILLPSAPSEAALPVKYCLNAESYSEGFISYSDFLQQFDWKRLLKLENEFWNMKSLQTP